MDATLPLRDAISPAEASPASARLGEALSVAGIVHAYSGAPAVDDVSFDVPAGGVADPWRCG